MEYIPYIITALMGLMMIWINLFGGEVSYSSKGAIPQIREFLKRRKSQKELEKWYRDAM
jgi:hypothetical protein